MINRYDIGDTQPLPPWREDEITRPLPVMGRQFVRRMRVRMITWRALTITLGADLALLGGSVMAQVVPTPTIATSQIAVAPLPVQQMVTILLYFLAILLGASAWACRPDDIYPPVEGARSPTFKAMVSSFVWGSFAVFLGLWKGVNPWFIAASSLVVAAAGHFMTLALVWLGRNFARNPPAFVRRWRMGGDAMEDERRRDRENGINPRDRSWH